MNYNQLIKRFSNCPSLKYLGLAYPQIVEQTVSALPSNSNSLDKIQQGYLNFYPANSISPFAPIDAKGPWILTQEHQIVYDVGGYGMLGFGHNPDRILEVLGQPQTMANIMTPNPIQDDFFEEIKKHLSEQYQKIICLNSGSEANSFAMRLAQIHQHPNPVKISLVESFHGRTELPAQVSGSCLPSYQQHLADFKNLKNYFIEINNLDHLNDTFEMIKLKNQFPEITIVEPVMGEGQPGVAMTPEFYQQLRSETQKMGGLLLVDSVQAGIRCTGELSITQYPGFQHLDPPDMETFSKAINGGQFPLSVVAMTQQVAERYVPGLYGNTMTANPRGLSVGLEILKQLDSKVKKNIVSQGQKLKQKLTDIKEQFDLIESVSGTGLLVALEFETSLCSLKIEKQLRIMGLNVIHGGTNALRLTPWFHISEPEIDLISEQLINVCHLIKENRSKFKR